MFSLYPIGWPGLGLAILRAAAGTTLMAQAFICYQAEQDQRSLMLAMGLVAALMGMLLLIGFLTRLATAVATLAAMNSMVRVFPVPRLGPLENRSTALLTLVIAVAIALVGPGGFSLDARLFGRREVVIPSAPDIPD